MKYLLFLFITISSFSCTRYITETITEYQRDSVIVHIRDTILTIKPDTAEILNFQQLFPLDSSPIEDKITTDTIWVEGKYSDAYSLIWDNEHMLGLVEGKEFQVKIDSAIRETQYWKEKFHSKETVLPAKSNFNLWPMLIIFAIVLAGCVIAVIKIISTKNIFK